LYYFLLPALMGYAPLVSSHATANKYCCCVWVSCVYPWCCKFGLADRLYSQNDLLCVDLDVELYILNPPVLSASTPICISLAIAVFVVFSWSWRCCTNVLLAKLTWHVLAATYTADLSQSGDKSWTLNRCRALLIVSVRQLLTSVSCSVTNRRVRPLRVLTDQLTNYI